MAQFKHPQKEIMIMGSGHSLILPHMPKVIPQDKYGDLPFNFQEPEKTGLYNLGFFSGPDYNNFYPGISREDFVPSEGDFIEPTFRMLSEVIVRKSYSPVDFSKAGVLKASMNLWVGQTVTPDHNSDVGDAIGSVKSTFWQESFKQAGITIPAGINGVLKIDAKSNPRIARGILMDPPSIHSNSVSVNFLWDKSHPNLTDEEFWDKLGNYTADGELVRKVVKEITAYYHTSLVSHGADPFAQKVDGGKINNPTHASKQEYQNREGGNISYYAISFKDKVEELKDNTMLFNMKSDTNNFSNNNNNNKNMNEEEIKLLLATLVGTGLLQLEDGKEVNKENLQASIKALVTEKETLVADKAALEATLAEKETLITGLNSQVTDLTAQMETLKASAAIGVAHISNLRLSTTEIYKKVMNDKVDNAIVELIKTASKDTLDALNKQYTEQLEVKFPMSCTKCGSKEVNRGSSVDNEDHEDNNVETTMETLAAAKRNKSILQ